MNAMSDTPIWPTLRAENARKLIDFYVAAFGFTELVAYTDDTGRIAHAEVAGPHGGGVMLGDGPADTSVDAWSLRPGTFGAYVVLPDAAAVDALYERAVAAGATVEREPYDPDHGGHDCTLLDPEGNHWQFGTYPGHPVS